MKILFATSHFGFLRNFEHGLVELARRGHQIHLLADRRENLGGMRTIGNLSAANADAFTWGFAPSSKRNRWFALGTVLRQCLDYWRYLDVRYDRAPALRRRAATQVPAFAVRVALWPIIGSRPVMAIVRRLVKIAERAVPPSPSVNQVLDEQQPDLVVLTPLLYFGGQQVDYVRAARARGIPTLLAVGSWDHLTTKGLIHEIPDGVTVWNEVQRTEAVELHGVPRSIIRVTGAQAYDHWFSYQPTLSREEFCARVELPADRPLLLYLCSSPFIAPHEVGFVRRWLDGIRQHPDGALRAASILIRPHPQNADQWKDVNLALYGAVAIWPRAGSNPVDREAQKDYFHSMFYSTAVVGVNTSALIESGIVGRPVYSIRSDEFAGTREGTLHFQHLISVNGGLLTTAETLEEHYGHLAARLAEPSGVPKGREFIEAFIRPQGLDRPAAPLFAGALEEVGKRGRRSPTGTPSWAPAIRPLLLPAAAAAVALRRERGAPRTDSEPPAARHQRILFVMASPEYLRFYDATIRELAARGHQVLIAVNIQRELKPARMEGFASNGENVTFCGFVPPRDDIWGGFADGVRGTMDWVRFLDPRFAGTPALRARMKRKCLPRFLEWLDRIPSLSTNSVRRILGVLALLERVAPVSREVQAFVESQQADAVLVTPLVDAASEQVDVVRAAKSLGIPSGVCVASWDNLTNKGLMRIEPELVTVWNDIQKREAIEFHGIRPDRVVVTGAQSFDRWFEKTPSRSREDFCAMLGFDAAKPIVLFTGSSFFISGEHAEVPFVRKWMAALRSASDPLVREANILVRPHPYNADQWAAADISNLPRVAVFPKSRYNPTDEQNRADFYDSIFHCAVVVGVNTSAMIEASIVGRPVHAVLTEDFAATQEGTIHFRYLLPENGGFLRVARSFEEHVLTLARSMTDSDGIRRETARFVATFIRPEGVTRPAVPILAGALETLEQRTVTAEGPAHVGVLTLRVLLAPPVALVALLGAGRHGQRLNRAVGSIRKRSRFALHQGFKQGRIAVHRGRKHARNRAYGLTTTVAAVGRRAGLWAARRARLRSHRLRKAARTLALDGSRTIRRGAAAVRRHTLSLARRARCSFAIALRRTFRQIQ